MVKVSLLILIASLVTAEDVLSPSQDESSPNLNLGVLGKTLHDNEKEETGKLDENGKIDSVAKTETEKEKIELTELQLAQPESNLNVEKAFLPEKFNLPGINARKRTNVKQTMAWPKLPTLDLSNPFGIRKPTVCNYEEYLDPASNQMVLVQSKNFPAPYPPGFTCRWTIKSPNNTRISLTCDTFNVPKCVGCRGPEGFYVSRSGDAEFKDAKLFYGQSFSPLESVSNSLSIIFVSQRSSKRMVGRFNCRVEIAEEETNRATATLAQCSCGWTNNRFRIVNGQPAGVNEFPFMCGVVTDQPDDPVMCGCTLISSRYVLTAAHCVRSLSVSSTAVLLGDHDTSTGTDTSSAIVVRAAEFKPYPYYDLTTQRYDLALIRLQSPVSYNQNIGPACLPIQTANWDLRGQTVTVMGWGTTSFGGPRSSVLMKTYVNIIDMSYCNATYGSQVSWDTQYCTYGEGTDACQSDSGGPVVWRNPYTGRYELVATVEYGQGCAFGYPSINNRVAPFLQWISDNTPGEVFCYA